MVSIFSVEIVYYKLGFVGVFAQHPSIVLSTFSKVAPCAQQRSPRRRTAISFLLSFFLCGYTAKEKSITKANYLLIPRLFSRFLCKKRRKES
jgi:hypothetical protein